MLLLSYKNLFFAAVIPNLFQDQPELVFSKSFSREMPKQVWHDKKESYFFYHLKNCNRLKHA